MLIRQTSLPITSSGKVQRNLCREQYLAGDLKTVHSWTNPAPASSAKRPATHLHVDVHGEGVAWGESGELGAGNRENVPTASRHLPTSVEVDRAAERIETWLWEWLVARLGPEARGDWERMLELGARAARLAAHFHARGDVRDPRDLVGFLLGRRPALGDVVPFARHASLATLLEKTIRTPALRALLGHFSRFLGLDARAAPSVALVIPYLLATGGVWYPRGGFAALARSLM